jgi:hypothetical protein
MASRVNALKTPYISELAMNWGLSMGALLIAIPMVWTVTVTNVHEDQEAVQETAAEKGSIKESV